MRYLAATALVCALAGLLVLAWQDDAPQSRHPPSGWSETLEALQLATCYADAECLERMGE